MKKFLLSLAIVALSVTAAWADVVEFDFVKNEYGMTRLSGTTSEYNADGTTVTNGAVTLTLNGNTRLWKDGLRFYTGSKFTVTADGYTVTGVEFPTTTAAGKFNYNGSALSVASWTGNVEAPVFECNISSKNCAVGTLKITIEKKGDPAKEDADLSFDVIASVVAMDQIDAFKAPELNNPNNLPVIWTSSDEAVATVDENGKVTIKAEGTTKITATSEATDKFNAGTASYNLVVRRAGIIFDNPCTTEDCGFKSEIVNGEFDPWSIDAKYGLKATGYVSGTRNASDAIMYREFDIPEGKIAVLNFQQALNYFGEYTAENVNSQLSIVAGKVVDGVVSSYEKVGEINLDPNQTKFSFTFYSNDEIKLPASLSGKIIIGFRYTSTTSVAGTWEITNVMVNTEDAPTVPAEITAIEAISVGATGNLAATYEEEQGCWMLMGTVMTESDNVKEFEIQVAVAEGAELWYYAMSDESGVEPLAEGEVESELPPLTQSLDGKITLTSGQGGVIIYTKRNGVLSEPAMLQYAVEIEQKPSGIQTIENENETVVYDLFGRRINSTKALKGLYIVNGKKTIIR